ncbi:MAG: NADH-quinone oxidoreductase subunit NuoH [Caulobacterales bacterium]|nr:NADH-quinone oxidoreductase subunit NuoH [Caulobacterales bacterium]MCA0373193.1 NADH-quinone oxidoreductase subunit NuoH [Pseudomonadota bacterium]
MQGLVHDLGAFWGTLAGIGLSLLYLVAVLLTVAFILVFDRKVWAAVQMRKGPNVVGPFGLLQSFADFLKFVLKEIVIPSGANKTVFVIAPVITVLTSFMAWAVVPMAPGWGISNMNVGILYILAISSLGIYGIIMGGWASNSKYPFLGALRSAAQMVSYEVSIGFVIVTVLLLVGSLNLTDIVNHQKAGIWDWHAFSFIGAIVHGGSFAKVALGVVTGLIMFMMLWIFFISALAETNRPPFDLPEAESELVAGYQVEYSATLYLLFMMAEYVNIVFMCAMISIMFLGGWNLPWAEVTNPFIGCLVLYVKIWVIFFLFAMVKAIVPRYRYDQLMRIGWKIFLPTTLVAVAVVGAYVAFFGGNA